MKAVKVKGKKLNRVKLTLFIAPLHGTLNHWTYISGGPKLGIWLWTRFYLRTLRRRGHLWTPYPLRTLQRRGHLWTRYPLRTLRKCCHLWTRFWTLQRHGRSSLNYLTNLRLSRIDLIFFRLRTLRRYGCLWTRFQTLRRRGCLWTIRPTFDFPDRLEFYSSLNSWLFLNS